MPDLDGGEDDEEAALALHPSGSGPVRNLQPHQGPKNRNGARSHSFRNVSALEDEIWNLRVRQDRRTYYWDYSLWWDGGDWWPDFDHDDFTVLELD